MRVAAVDQGTNTTRLLVADVEDGELEEVAKRVEITRLGEGVDARRRLLPLPITRVRPPRAAPPGSCSPRRAPSGTRRTARRSSGRSSGATGS